jgi:hypothetical protein
METKQRSKSCDFNPVDQRDCSICTMEFETGDDISSPFACGHRFHRDCINTWINRRRAEHRKPTCAYCKSEFIISEYFMSMEFEFFDISSETQDKNVNENYQNPPDIPDPVPTIYPLFPNERKRQILMNSRNNWARYFNKFNNYNRLTTRRRSHGQIEKDYNTLRDIRNVVDRLDQMLTELND